MLRAKSLTLAMTREGSDEKPAGVQYSAHRSVHRVMDYESKPGWGVQ